jgi:exodeoxyribonuclease VII small subunit
MTEEIGYGEAVAELEEILDEIESDDVDVDLLSVRVRRAAELIRICRRRIHATRMEVEEIVAGLETSPAAAAPAGDDVASEGAT